MSGNPKDVRIKPGKKMESGQQEKQEQKLDLVYTLFCDDVRLEVGNKLSYMGVFQNIVVPQLPVWLPKLAVVNHWRGEGAHFSEGRILMPNRHGALGVSPPAAFVIFHCPSGHNQFFCDLDFSLSV